MLKKLTLLVAAMLLAGCGLMPKPLETGKVDPAMSALQVKAQATVNEARRVLISVDQLIGESVSTGMWTPDESQKYLDVAKGYRRTLDDTQKVLDSGNFQKAITEAGATQLIVDKLLEELIAAKARAAKSKAGAALDDLVPFLV